MPSEPADVGFVVKMFPRLSETFILNEVLELERRGLRLRIFCLLRPVEQAVHAHANLVRAQVTYLPERLHREPGRVLRGLCTVFRRYPGSTRQTLLHLFARSSGLRASIKGWKRFCQACCLIDELGPIRHLHAHYAMGPSKVALLVHKITQTTYSITTHAKDLYQFERLGSPLVLERLRLARFIVANCHYSANRLRGSVEGSGRIHTIYNGIDLQTFPRRAKDATEPIILSIGRLVEKKGFGDLIEACRILRERGIRFQCEIGGKGPLLEVLRGLIKQRRLEDHIKLLGALPQQELLSRLDRAMVFALPCVIAADGDRDLLPNVIKEAMAIGLPVVTTNIAGMDELIEDGVSSILVPANDPAALARSLESILASPALRERLASHSRRMIEERFDRRISFAKLYDLLVESAQAEPVVAGGTERHTNKACAYGRAS
jgi:glycosyltransferase involved in cell wall biosynthesis